MNKIDFKKELKYLYKPSAKKVEFVDVPKMNFLMINGKGSPTIKAFQEAVEALFSLSYTLKFMVKKGKQQIDYGVLPLEGLWWTDDMTKFSVDKKDEWKWKIMIMQPKYVTEELVQQAIKQVNEKKESTCSLKNKIHKFY